MANWQRFSRRYAQATSTSPPAGRHIEATCHTLTSVHSARAATLGAMHMVEIIYSGDPDTHAVMFVRTWAEAVLRQVERARDARNKWRQDNRNWERMEDWSPTEQDVDKSFRRMWAEEHMLIWTAYQLEQWQEHLAVQQGTEPPERDEKLRLLRNALEHLSEATFDESHAVVPPTATPKQFPALRKLGGLAISSEVSGIPPEVVEERALHAVATAQTALEDAINEAAQEDFITRWIEDHRGE